LTNSKPANRDEWVFASVDAYRKLRPEVGENYAKVHALQAYNTLKSKTPADAAKAWATRA
jgi:hypothetical protein